MKNYINLKPLSISTNSEIIVKGLDNISEAIEKLNSTKKMNLKFNLPNLSSEFEYNGLKIIVCDEPNLIIRDLLNDEFKSKILINNTMIKNKYIYHIHCFSKVSDFLNTRNNSTLHEYLKTKDIHKINQEIQNFITTKFYSLGDQDIESISDIDLEKASLLDYLDISNEYINNTNIFNLLNIIKNGTNDKQLILINDYNILDIEQIIWNFIDSFNFLIFTDNIKKWITNFKYAECLVIINDFIKTEFKIDALDILDKDTLIKYIEKNLKDIKKQTKLYINNFEELE